MNIIQRFTGPRYIQMAKNWLPTLGAFGTASGLLMLYLTDWKTVLQYVPYVKGRFAETNEKKE